MWSITSPAFREGSPIPVKFTCQGEDVSPALEWTDPPEGTKHLALVMDDPDAPGGTFTHWVVTSIPVDRRSMPEGIGRAGSDPALVQGVNSFRRAGYGGPCPPPGKPHRYYFRLYAFSEQPELPSGSRLTAVHIESQKGFIAKTELMGTYQRR